jgi:NDP-sugar pyrophosphorylase family protein
MNRRKVKIDLGVILCNGGPEVVGYIEKPTYDYSVSMGIYVFEPRVLSYIPPGEHLDFPNLVHKLLGAKEKVIGYPFEGYWQDLGRPDDYEQAGLDFERMREEFLPEEIS